MELWIRSQDREDLIKVDYVRYSEAQGTRPGNILNANYNHCITLEYGTFLGRYETKERALEVLDEIQNILKPNIKYVPIVEEDVKPEYTYKHYKSVGYEVSGCKFEQFDTYVYEMPKE